jgi:unsaturated rhamnogalacturonyl hydrolase
MNRRQLIRGTAFLAAGRGIACAEDPRPPDWIPRAMAAALSLQRRDWEQGILAQAFFETGDNDNLIRLTKAAIVQRTSDGRLAVVNSGGPTDPAMGGEAYWRAGQLTGDGEIQDAVRGMLTYLLQKAPRAADGTLYHVFQAPQVWSDGFNGAPPFFAAMGRYDEAIAQIEGFRKRLWDPKKKLLSNVWDDGTQNFKRRDFWGTGQGWAAAGLARVVRLLPPERRQDRERLSAFVRDIVDGCLVYQRPDGLFHDVVDRPETFVETNLAQMLAYAIYTGAAGGWLDRQYLARADSMRQAARGKMDQYGFVHDVCGAPRFDRAGLSTEGQSFFLMMEAAGNRVGRRAG